MMSEQTNKLTIACVILLAIVAGIYGASSIAVTDTASANQCANACYAAHSQCRVAHKGSPACDAQLSRCLSSCGRR